MDRAKQYQRNEQEAVRRAARALSPDERESYEKIARSWRDLAAAVGRSEPERD
jgi:hypothetical protein